MLKLGLSRIPQGYLSLQVGNQLEAQFTETLEDVVYCGYNCRSSHVGEGITMVQIDAPEFSCQGRNQHGATEGPEFSCQRRNQHGATQKRSRNFLCAEHIQKR
ncbi:unnamed protein product [Sphagnum jensenii]|uniref:Uncharacterized protein n=1 Tax=Sphagnum jensenii TaxID=128206 RepID=A0ABP0WLV2_9BRYO